MPQFCRHGRFEQNCRICNPPSAAPEPKRRAASGSAATRSRTSSPRRSSGGRSSGVVVRRVARAVDDGYASELVPGLHASADARRLAAELAFSTARLAELAADPPGLYAEAALADDLEESLWLAFLIAHVSPLAADDDGDGFDNVRAVRVPWATGEAPRLDGVALGPRTTVDRDRPERTAAAYRAWAARAGSQAAALSGDDAWTPERRFGRVFERLSLPGFARAGRFELLASLGRLGLVDVAPDDLKLGEAADGAVIGAKRVFGIGERLLLERRAADLAEAAGVPLDALDLALFNFAQPEGRQATMGARARADGDLVARLEAALGL